MPKFRRRPASEAPYMGPNYYDNIAFTIGVQAGSVINVALVLQDANNNTIPGSDVTDIGPSQSGGEIGPAMAGFYLSDNADGSTLTATAITTIAIGTNGVILNIPVAGKYFEAISTLAGLLDFNLTKNAARTTYLCVIMPNGQVLVSPPIVFT